MLVLKIIGVIVALVIANFIIDKFNQYTNKKYRYEFIDWGSYFIVAISYAFIFFGERAYTNAYISNGDILNGQLLVGIGIIGLIFMSYINIKSTNLLMGILGSLFQFTIYIGLAIIGAVILFIASAVFSQTKPVYNLNR